jgi:hypothetical protein
MVLHRPVEPGDEGGEAQGHKRGQSRLKGLHDPRTTGETRSAGKNRHQEPLRQRTSFIERLCSCISACEICLARASYRCPNRRVCPQGDRRAGGPRNPIMNHTNRWPRYPFQTYLPQGQGTVSAGCCFSKGFRQTGQFFCHMFAPVFSLANRPQVGAGYPYRNYLIFWSPSASQSVEIRCPTK